MDSPSAPLPPIRLRSYYRTAGALLRELSRALNRGRTLLRAESGLAVGTRLALVMVTDSLKAPIEVSGTVTASRRRRAHHEMTVRYDFDPGPFRSRLAQAMAELRRDTRPPRLATRLPLALGVDAVRVARRLRATIENLSRTGCRLELQGSHLPGLAVGARLDMVVSGSRPGSRSPRRLLLEIRWMGRWRPAPGGGRVEVGGRFLAPSAAARQCIRNILRFDDLRPRIRIRALVPQERAKTRVRGGRPQSGERHPGRGGRPKGRKS